MLKLGIGLAVVLLLGAINSTYFFLGVSKVKPIEWIVFNACAPSSIAYLIGFAIFLLTKNRIALHIGILPLFFFGGLGLFFFPWSGYNLIAQFSHVIMVLNMLWAVYGTLSTGDYKAAVLGLLIGIGIFAPFIGYQQSYVNTHPEDFQRILGVSSEEFHNKMMIGPVK